MKSKFQNYFKSVFSNFSKIISREIRENNYFEFLEKFSRRTQSNLDVTPKGMQGNSHWNLSPLRRSREESWVNVLESGLL
jgi:hypothetical protein